MKISVKTIVFVSILLLGRQANVSADPTSDSMFQILSWSVSALITRMDKMENKITLLQERVETLEATPPYTQDRSSYEADVENEERENFHMIRAMLSDEKSIIRNSIRDMRQQFKEMKEELHTNVSKIKESFEVKASDMMDIVSNNSATLTTEIALLKHDLNTTMNTSSQALDVFLEKQENNTKERLSLLEASFQSYTGNQFSSIRTDIGSLFLELSSLSSKESSESSSLSSRMSSTSLSLSSLASRENIVSFSLSSISYSMSSSISSLSSILYDEERTTIGFSARLNPADSYYESGEKIKFNDVQYNIGGGYDPSTGIFSAPRTGSTDTGFIHAVLVARGIERSQVIAQGYKHMGTNAAVVYLYSGLPAYVRIASLKSKYYTNSYRGQFVGVLLD